MNTQPSKLSTPRLRLRPFEQSDAIEVSQYAGDKRVQSMTRNMPHPYTIEYAQSWILTHEALFLQGSSRIFAVCLKESGQLIGSVSATLNHQTLQAEIGFWIAVPYWGNGYGTEAVKALVQHLFCETDTQYIFAQSLSKNLPSKNILQKLGMNLSKSFLQKFPDKPEEVLIEEYSLSKKRFTF